MCSIKVSPTVVIIMCCNIRHLKNLHLENNKRNNKSHDHPFVDDHSPKEKPGNSQENHTRLTTTGNFGHNNLP